MTASFVRKIISDRIELFLFERGFHIDNQTVGKKSVRTISSCNDSVPSVLLVRINILNNKWIEIMNKKDQIKLNTFFFHLEEKKNSHIASTFSENLIKTFTVAAHVPILSLGETPFSGRISFILIRKKNACKWSSPDGEHFDSVKRQLNKSNVHSNSTEQHNRLCFGWSVACSLLNVISASLLLLPQS